MKAGIIVGTGALELQEFPLPERAGDGRAVVSISRCGVCGSDVAAFRDGEQYPPFLSGHEWVGVVLNVGEGVEHLAVGDRVVAGTPPACGRCSMCAAGHAERCQELMKLAFAMHPHTPAHGGFAERIEIPAESLVRVPEALSDDQAAMVEPATVALHAVRRRQPRIGDVVVVLGAGPVGLFVAQLARIGGAGNVIVVEPRDRRRGIALDVGASHAVTPDQVGDLVQSLTDGRGADIVYDCVGNQSAMAAAVDVARPGATVMMVGVATGDVSVSPLAWLSKELRFDTSLAHLNYEFAITMELIAAGRLRTDPLLDLTVGLDGLSGVLEELAEGHDYVKVLVDPSRSLVAR